MGVDMLEMDMHATTDGALGLVHDATVDRTTNGSGPIREMTLARLKDLDAGYRWSPDGKWFLVQYVPSDRMFVREVGLVSSDGKGEVRNLTLSGYNDFGPKWVLDGKMMIWGSSKRGLRHHANQGAQFDIYAMFFTKEAHDRFKLSKAEFELLKKKEEKEKKAKKDREKKNKKNKDKNFSYLEPTPHYIDR